jgi:hypothetical protein
MSLFFTAQQQATASIDALLELEPHLLDAVAGGCDDADPCLCPLTFMGLQVNHDC